MRAGHNAAHHGQAVLSLHPRQQAQRFAVRGCDLGVARALREHKEKTTGGFTAKYDVNRSVYYELHGSAEAAIAREKQLKRWNRAWKIRLIEKQNPEWQDLYAELVG